MLNVNCGEHGSYESTRGEEEGGSKECQIILSYMCFLTFTFSILPCILLKTSTTNHWMKVVVGGKVHLSTIMRAWGLITNIKSVKDSILVGISTSCKFKPYLFVCTLLPHANSKWLIHCLVHSHDTHYHSPYPCTYKVLELHPYLGDWDSNL